MRFLIDTSSLSILVRYYIPFDKSGLLKKLFKEKIISGEIILIDKVVEESSFVSKKIIIKTLDYLLDKKLQTNTDNLLPYPKFFNMLENEFANHVQKGKLNEFEFEEEKKRFLNTADIKFILYCLEEKKKLGIDKTILVTEETVSDNDNKAFKKLPQICQIKDIPYCNIVELLQTHFNIKMSDYLE
jgi:hypothetical protein